MHAPRKACVPVVVVAAMMLFGPLSQPTIQACQAKARGTHRQGEYPAPSKIDSGRKLPGLKVVTTAPQPRLPQLLPRFGDVVRTLCVLAMTMGISPFDLWAKPATTTPLPPEQPPPDNPVPPVVPPPSQPPTPITTTEVPPGQPPPSGGVPEPTAVVSALVGSSLVLCQWWRRRRRVRATPGEARDQEQ